MKRFNLLKILSPLIFLIFSVSMQAQVSVNVNIGAPPSWGPYGYSDVRFYYIPDVEAYYDVQTSMFIYFGNGVWLHRAQLPTRYRYYDLYSGYKVVLVDYRGTQPYVHFHNHKIKYAKGYHNGNQKTIGQKPGKSQGSSQEKSGSKNDKGVKSQDQNKGNKGHSGGVNNKSGGGNNKGKGK